MVEKNFKTVVLSGGYSRGFKCKEAGEVLRKFVIVYIFIGFYVTQALALIMIQ